MRKLLSFATCAALALLCLPSSRAADAKKFEAKVKSTFTGTGHNPFWPIGWEKPEIGNAVANQAAPIMPHASDFLVTTIMLAEPRLAMINGKAVAEGETTQMMLNGQPTTVQLMSVQDGGVVMRWQNVNIPVPLHRLEDLSKPGAANPDAVALH